MAIFSKAFLTSPQGRIVWTIIAISATLAQLPFWLVLYALPLLRPHPKWTLSQAIKNRLLRSYVQHRSEMEAPTLVRLEPGAEKERFVLIDPSEKDVYRGALAATDIKPETTGGIWFPVLHNPDSGFERNVVLYCHGGAFVLGEGRPADCGFALEQLSDNFNADVFSLSYRLSGNPGQPFPAALQDLVTAYRYLLDIEISAKRIILAGDSCGGNLVVALLRYIADNTGVLPQPAAAVLCSPWLDLASARDPTIVDTHRNSTTDYLPGIFTAWGANAYAPASMHGVDAYTSPRNHPFRTGTPLWICVGGVEILCDQGVGFAEKMKAMGNSVEIHIEPYATHALLGAGNRSGFTAEAENAARLAGKWLADINDQHALH